MKQQLVIIPGWGGTKESWQKFIDLTRNDFEVFFIALPGFGEMPPPKELWGVSEFVGFIKKEIAKLNLNKPIILGHSFGGQLAVNLVGNNPEMFSELILSGAAVLRPKYVCKRFVLNIIAKTGKFIFNLPGINKFEKLTRKIFYRVIDSPDYDKTDGMKREIYKKIIRESQIEMLPKIKIPCLVIWGDKDSYVPLTEGKIIANSIVGAKLVVIKDGKHGLHIQQPENLLKIIKENI